MPRIARNSLGTSFFHVIVQGINKEYIFNKEDYLLNCINYIHMNPVKANMVSKCSEYKYSSYNQYIKNSLI